MSSQPSYPVSTTIGGQNSVVSVVVGYIDTNGVFVAASAANGLPTTGGGGGGGGVVSFAAAANYASAALEASHVVKATAGTLWGLSVFNNSASDQYYQLFDSATLPADGVVPIEPMKVIAGGTGSWSFSDIGRAFASGIVVCNSSTGVTKTIGSADSLFDAQYS